MKFWWVGRSGVIFFLGLLWFGGDIFVVYLLSLGVDLFRCLGWEILMNV